MSADSNYYMLECYVPDDKIDIARLKAVYFKGLGSWRIGKPFTMELPNPISISIMDGYPDNLKEFYNNDALVMTKKMYQILLDSGVSNMDMYPCEISNNQTGFKTHDYVAVNLLGLVKKVDLEKSTFLMFRLAENTSAIMVHKSIKEALLNEGLNMLSFIEPNDWIG